MNEKIFTKIKNKKIINYIIIAFSFVVRFIYILQTNVGDRQHDLGYATLLDDGLVNPGHLGYIEYLVKFHHLPDFDPFSIFSYYHPPLHHIIAAFFLETAHNLGMEEPGVYEVIQIPTLIYSCIMVIIAYKILQFFCKDECKISIPLAFVAFFPGFIYMTGSINNDMLATMLSFLCIYLTLIWIREPKFKYLILMALSIGLGIIAKPTAAVIACPMALVMLMHFIKECKNGRAFKCFMQYVVFAAISLPIGLSWTVRNIILYSETPGIPSSNAQSNQYLWNYPINEIFGMPIKASVHFPFHSENSIYCHNAWSILFKTSVFAEVWPEDISDGWLFLCRLLFVLALAIGILCFILCIVLPILRIRQGETLVGTFLLSGYLTVVITYIMFVIKYPYTCSCDFRYVPTAIMFAAVSLLPRNKTTDNS